MTTPITAFEHIRTNNIKTFFLLLMFPVSLIVLFYLVSFLMLEASEQQIDMVNQFVWDNIPWIFCISSVWILFSCIGGDKMVLGFADAKELSNKNARNKEIYRLVENTALMAGLPVPKVYVIEDDSLNAFATGYSPKTASIALTQGIIRKLKPLELQGVIAHELAHVGNRDIRLDMVVVAGLSVFALIAEMLRYRLMISGRRDTSEHESQVRTCFWIVFIVLMIFHAFVAPLIRMAVSRTREFAADATGAMITHHPEALASALKKISSDARVEVLDAQPSMAALCIYSPLARKAALSDTHPPVEERIKRLEIMAGMRVVS